MILYLYLILLALTLVFFVLGFLSDNPILSIAAGGFLFLLGYTLMGVDAGIGYPVGVDIPTGSTVTAAYTYNNTTLQSSTETKTITTTAYTSRTFGFFLELIGFAAIFLTLLSAWRSRT